MDTKELRKFLQTVYNVESRIYELEQIKATLDKIMSFSNAPDKRLNIIFDESENEYAPMLTTDSMAEVESNEIKCYHTLEDLKRFPVRPVANAAKPVPPPNKAIKVITIIMWVTAVLGIIPLVLGFIVASRDMLPAVLLWLFSAGVLAIALLLHASNRKALNEYNKKLAAYTAEQDRFKEKKLAYEAKLATAQEQYDAASMQLTTLRRDALALALATADTNLRSVQQTLATLYASRDQLYASEIIFPKYRNLPAVATMLEYLQAGRCAELEGPSGAYNLYESESRADLIIVKLDKILSKLDNIQQTQYNLYRAVSKTNKLLETMSGQMKDILRTQQKQLEISAITASCTAAVAANTEAIKYLTLVN